MIKLISGDHRSHFPSEIDQMHRLRYRIFHEIKNWEVPLINNWEVDGYDALNPLYVLSIDDRGLVRGALRLLPTTSFNMLNDTFPQLLPEGARVESPLIWECSRFVVDHDSPGGAARRKMAKTTAELALAMNEIGMASGLSHIVCVYEHAMHRMLSLAGCAGTPLCGPLDVGGVLAYSVTFEIGDALRTKLERASGITSPIIAPSEPTLMFAA